MTKADMDRAIREAWGCAADQWNVDQSEHIAFIAGMRAGAEVIYHAPPASLFSCESCRDVLRAAADELERA